MARYPIKMLLDKDLGPFIPYLPSNAVVVEGSDETVADQITDLHNEINEKISNVYRYKGSVTFENLPITGQVTGDVYNITNDFELDGHPYSAGTNLAWAENHWDPLTGLTNLDNTIVELNLSVDLMPTVRSINGYAFTIEANKIQWLKMINDAIKAGKDHINFITARESGYYFRLYIPNTSDGTQNVSMYITTPINLLYNLHYGDTYWYMKTIKITFANNIATDITVQTGTSYSYKEWLYPQFRNTTAFTPTAATHLVPKGYVDDTIMALTNFADNVITLDAVTAGSLFTLDTYTYNGVLCSRVKLNNSCLNTNKQTIMTLYNAMVDSNIEYKEFTIRFINYTDPHHVDYMTYNSNKFIIDRQQYNRDGFIKIRYDYFSFYNKAFNTNEHLRDYPKTAWAVQKAWNNTVESISYDAAGHITYLPDVDTENSTICLMDNDSTSTDLSNDFVLEDPTAAVSLMKVRYANVGDSFSLSYIIAATADTHGTVFITKIPSAHFYKTIPTAYDYHPIGAVTYFEYDSVSGSADPKPAYGYTRFSDTDPDWVRIVIYPLNYDNTVGIKAQSYFYVDFNWIRI